MTDAEWGNLGLIIYGAQNLDFKHKHFFFKQLTINKDNETK